MNLKEIKDAARQAFRDQQTQDTEGGVSDAVSFCAGFLAGAKHRQYEIDKLVEALKFYENCSALMLKQRDLPIDPILGRSVLTERHVQDNGDVARQALKEIGEE